MIHSYNQFMSGVEESDKMLYAYLDERRTLKFWKKVVFNVFSRMVLNSYIIYLENSDKKLTRTIYIGNCQYIRRRMVPCKKYFSNIFDNTNTYT